MRTITLIALLVVFIPSIATHGEKAGSSGKGSGSKRRGG